MPATKREPLSGWGHTPIADCTSYRPEKQRDVRDIMSRHEGPLLARGLGRSYADASLQPAGVMRMERLNHLIEFDSANGIVHAQAGVTLAELMDLFVPRGFLPPVLPGTRHVTLGGAFACNVHGKNHWREGDFAEHVICIKLTLANGETIECSPTEYSDIFWATAGGMGMTGIIEEVTLRLKPIASCSLRTTSYKVDSVEDMIGGFEHYRSSADYMVGWIDHMARDKELGRGVFEAGNHILSGDGGAALNSFEPLKKKITVPFNAPSFLLNRYSMALYNRWRFKRYSSARHLETVDFNGFFHPLDAIGQWNRLYGSQGFFQYQCLFPEDNNVTGNIRDFLAAIQQKGLFSFLAVIKYHRDGKGLLTFPKRGYSLALDFPNTARVRNLLPQLDAWVTDRGGRTYLAKDAQLKPDLFHAMYGDKAQEWCALIRDVDPDGKFTSLMSQRLRWKSA
jgi:decaprenylphospho-beta-D-ribofuranose 2-oxidase